MKKKEIFKAETKMVFEYAFLDYALKSTFIHT